MLLRLLMVIVFFAVFCTAVPGPGRAAAQQPPLPNSPPTAENGIIDLAGWNLASDGVVKLDGEWAVYWRQLLEPGQFAAAVKGSFPSPDLYGRVPATWGHYALGGTALSEHSYATYRLTIKWHPAELGGIKSLYIPNAATAYKLWVDGRLLEENGLVGTSLETMVPKNYAKVVDFVPASAQTELVIQVSNFVQRKGGLWDHITLGTNDQIDALRENRMVLQLSIASCLSVMGIYHILLYTLLRRNKVTLYFGSICIAIGLRTLVVGETLLVRFIPSMPWEAAVKLEYLGFITGVPLMVAFVHSLYPRELAAGYRNVSIWIGAVCSALVVAVPARIYTYIMLPYQIFVLISFSYVVFAGCLAVRHKRSGARLNGFALLCLLLAGVNDTLYYNHLISTGDMFPFGMLVALLVQAYMLSVRFTQSFAQVERLSEQLAALNESLEQKIYERTAKLQKANDELVQMEKSRRKLLSHISHELGTPLTSIQGFVKGMLDGVFPPSATYLQRVFEKTRLLDRIIGDLHDLSRLESRQFKFSFRSIEVLPFIRLLYDKYELDVVKSGLLFERAEPESQNGEWVAVIDADPIRIEQVIANLLFNACKFTPEGGTIKIETVYVKDGRTVRWVTGSKASLPSHVTIIVSDTGIGIAEADLPHVFDRFFKGNRPEASEEHGVGLGLAIAKEIVACHHGEIGVSSAYEQGSRFYFTLPVKWVAKTRWREDDAVV
ncbi:Sensor histidine kinase RcsC [Paenibacillus allorhizosphaerae]|uniref:histidine kinase n=1 Tax=Paenibacillus allorhizosphaerae TaxID=2849866 RepID=A0ABM8VI99_9BACL|nr:Sensor histidine kinase RcsC [Paenibacillus allorhizosphaerae]